MARSETVVPRRFDIGFPALELDSERYPALRERLQGDVVGHRARGIVRAIVPGLSAIGIERNWD